MTIYDGGSSTSPMMGKYCDVSIPPSHISSSMEILIHFETDMWGLPGDPFTTGFQMEYNPIGKAHQLKTTLTIMRIIIEKYVSSIHLTAIPYRESTGFLQGIPCVVFPPLHALAVYRV